jgi:hemolysin activation/secretion protein
MQKTGCHLSSGLMTGAFLLLLTGHSMAWSQSLSPGELQRQVQPPPVSVLPKLSTIPPRRYEPSGVNPLERVTLVRAWALQGNSVIETAVLQQWLKSFTGVNLSFRQINEAAILLQQIYQDAGWVARVLVPEQDITDGTVTLRIIESRLGAVTVSPVEAPKVNLERVRRTVERTVNREGLLRTDLVERGVLLADDLSGISVASSYEAGTQEGTSDVVLLTSPEAWVSGNWMVDNGNSRSVGTDRGLFNLSLNSPFGQGESFSAQLLHSRGSDFARLGASVPVGYSGLKLSPYVSHMEYQVVTPDANGAEQDISGRVQAAGVDFSYPLIRQALSNLYLQSSWKQTRYNSDSNGLASRFQIDVGQIGLQGNFYDNWLSGGANTVNVAYHQGRKSRDPFGQADDTTVGDYRKFTWSANRQQVVLPSLTLYAAVQGQDTGSKPLDGSENMSLGGPNGVRAYPNGEASGPVGRMVNLELRWRLNDQWQLTPFYDWGKVSKRSSDTLPAYALKGGGLSLSWTGPRNLNAQVTYARRDGANPNPQQGNGKDQDGSLKRDRFWLSLNQSF